MLFIYFCHNVLSVMRGSDRPHISPPAASAGRLTPSRYHNTDLSLILNTGSLVTLGPSQGNLVFVITATITAGLSLIIRLVQSCLLM